MSKSMPRKTFFIVPGFKMSSTSRSFLWLRRFLEQKGFKVLIAPITWNYRTMDDYVAEFKVFYEKNRSKENYLLGFSYGAVIALLSANDLRPEKVYLCSLSPDFKEDLPMMKSPEMKSWIDRFVGKRRLAEIKRRSGREAARNLQIPSVVFYGGFEGEKFPSLRIRCEETASLAKRSKLVIVKDAPHDIRYPEYQKAILRMLRLV
jgi:pimeloyl-ACP methyl ester carboxylesterase